MNVDQIISEAQSFGLDVEAERCDTEIIADWLPQLHAMDAGIRSDVIDLMNEGWSPGEALKQIRGW